MSRGRRAAALACAVVVSLSFNVTGAPPTQAHSASTWFGGHWFEGAINFAITPSYPANSPYPFRDMLKRGRDSWPYDGGRARPNTGFSGTQLNWSPEPVCDYGLGANGIHYYPIDGPDRVKARTRVCVIQASRRIWNAQVVFDSGETWWPYAETPQSTHYDVWGVAAHELGHAWGGWLDPPQSAGHFGSTADCINPPTQTMCPDITRGFDGFRSTELHDRHTIAAEYPG